MIYLEYLITLVFIYINTILVPTKSPVKQLITDAFLSVHAILYVATISQHNIESYTL